MKKFLLAAAASLILFGGQTQAEASTVQTLDKPGVETQEVGKWKHFRDKYLLGRDDRDRDRRRRDRYRYDRRYDDPPPPPPPRHRYDRYNDDPPPPPPPRHRYDRYNDDPPPPPPRSW